jgi:hypothetical protein
MDTFEQNYQTAAKTEIEARLRERADPVATASYVDFSERIGLLDKRQAVGYKLKLERQLRLHIIKKALEEFEWEKSMDQTSVFLSVLAERAHMNRAALRRALDECLDEYLKELESHESRDGGCA